MSSIYENLSVEELINISLEREEGEIASNGALRLKQVKEQAEARLIDL